MSSILEQGIREPLQCVVKPGEQLILLDGFKRLRSASKLGIKVVPVVSLGSDEAGAILQLIRLPGRTFTSMEDLNRQGFDWATVRYAQRPLSRTRLIPITLFEEEKRLRSLGRISHQLMKKELHDFPEIAVSNDYEERKAYQQGRFSQETELKLYGNILKGKGETCTY